MFFFFFFNFPLSKPTPSSGEAGFHVNVVPCSEVLRSMAMRRRWSQALELLDEIRGRRRYGNGGWGVDGFSLFDDFSVGF